MALRRRRHARHLNAEVNMINLVDVMLVLLVVFMVTAPMMQGGIPVRLPRASAQPIQRRDVLVVTVERDGEVSIDDARVPSGQFESALRVAAQRKGARAVHIRGDGRTPYDNVMRVMDVVRRAGITDVGLVTSSESRP